MLSAYVFNRAYVYVARSHTRAALEPFVRSQSQSESRVNDQFSFLEEQIATITGVLKSSKPNHQSFQCDQCDRIFRNQRSLQNHRMFKNHRIQMTRDDYRLQVIRAYVCIYLLTAVEANLKPALFILMTVKRASTVHTKS